MVKADTSDAADNTTPTTVETIPSSDSDMLENTTTATTTTPTTMTSSESTETQSSVNSGSTESSPVKSTKQSENEASATTTSSSEVIPNSRLLTQNTAQHYMVTTFAELKEAATKPIPDGQTELIIELNNDIGTTTSLEAGLRTSDNVIFDKNTKVIGNGHAIFMNVANTAGTPLRTADKVNDITVTYQDVNFGKDGYRTWTYYGILDIGGNNVTHNIINVNYDINSGSQPFYADTATIKTSGSILNFSGNNSFRSTGTTGNQEFAESYKELNILNGVTTIFKDDGSNKSAYQFLTSSDARASINVKQNAILNITGNYESIVFQPITINIDGYMSFASTNKSSWWFTRRSDNIINVNKNGTFLVTSPNAQIDFYNQKIDVTSNQGKLFAIEGPSNNSTPLANGGGFTFSPGDIKYPQTIELLAEPKSSETLIRDTEFTSTNNKKLTMNPVTKNYRSIYMVQGLPENGPTIVTDTDTTPGHSALSAYIKDDDATNAITSIHYKISDKALTTGDITTDTNQNILDTVNDTALINNTTKKSVYGQSVTQAESLLSIDKLEPGDYYVYTQVSDTHNPNYIMKSKWRVDKITINSYISVSIPMGINDFTAYKKGAFDKNQNKTPYAQIKNESNSEILIKPSRMIEKTNSGIELVSEIKADSNNELQLNLNAIYTSDSTTPNQTWNSLTTGDLSYKDSLSLQPFWSTTELEAFLYVTGNYQGDMGTVKNVSYNVSFEISPTLKGNY